MLKEFISYKSNLFFLNNLEYFNRKYSKFEINFFKSLATANCVNAL